MCQSNVFGFNFILKKSTQWSSNSEKFCGVDSRMLKSVVPVLLCVMGVW